jgi:hypothetical protein
MIDTSALAQRAHPAVIERLKACLSEGAAVCDMVVAESLIRARSMVDLAARQQFFETIDVLSVDGVVWEEVFDLTGLLADGGRTVATGDAVIGACARIHDLTVIHYDADYDTLGAAADIDTEWVVPSGTL